MSRVKIDFIICYDISDPKRLSRIARVVERYALRIQYSLYLYEQVSRDEMSRFVQKVVPLMDEEADDLRIYSIRNRGLALGKAIDLDHPLIVR